MLFFGGQYLLLIIKETNNWSFKPMCICSKKIIIKIFMSKFEITSDGMYSNSNT